MINANFRHYKRRRRGNAPLVQREVVESAVKQYLKEGGKITRIEKIDGEYQMLPGSGDDYSNADDFLTEGCNGN